MPKSFEHVLQTITNFFSRMRESVKHLFKPNKQAVSNDTGQDKLPTVDEIVPLAVERPVIQVKCISCGELVELTGICQKCQEPICSLCRKEVYDEGMDMDVIQCSNCAATMEA